jgi:hypothetical protein
MQALDFTTFEIATIKSKSVSAQLSDNWSMEPGMALKEFIGDESPNFNFGCIFKVQFESQSQPSYFWLLNDPQATRGISSWPVLCELDACLDEMLCEAKSLAQ